MQNVHLVDMKNISKRFGGLQALSNVDLYLNKGEVLGLVGDNAAGKSTLMKILSGAIQQDEGSIFFEGIEIKYKSPKDARDLGIEMIYQDLALIRCLSVDANMFLGKELKTGLIGNFLKIRIDKKRMRKETMESLESLKIQVGSVQTEASNLSGGQQQSIAIARALHFNAKVIIMDEPTSALSIKETRKVLDLVIDFKGKGISAVMISHRIQDVFEVADRIVVLRHGIKVEDCRASDTTTDAIVKKIIGIEDNNIKVKKYL
ncbi:MAG: ATP-binding cassette domain-containing protein [Actinobacteria bacterium]|nr:ATP-binding cassette domain-containing protein [Actinomycetota bacterium]